MEDEGEEDKGDDEKGEKDEKRKNKKKLLSITIRLQSHVCMIQVLYI